MFAPANQIIPIALVSAIVACRRPWLFSGKDSACNAGVRFLGQEDYLEDGMTAHCSILVWRNP